jgi:mono/diheme cytochrome c family protein
VQQRLFVCASSVVNGFTRGDDRRFFEPINGNSFLGGATTFTRVARTGIIAALDVTTNKLAWRYQWPEQCYSGTLATAGGLLFVGRSDGRLTALDSATGKQLWEFQTGAGMHAPASTFEYKGKQYVLAFSAGAALLGTPRGDSVWLFALDGTLPPVQPGTPVSRQTAATPEPTERSARLQPGQGNLAAGQQLYKQTCVTCHGADGKGEHGAGAPLTGVTDLAAAIRTVTTGRNNMPPFGPSFTPEQIRDVSAYVVETLAGGGAR